MKKLLPVAAVLTFMTLMLVKPEFYLESARRGLAIYATTVLPALFPFFFCTSLLTKIGAVETMSAVGRRPMKFLFGAPPESAYVFLMSMMSGYPTGSAMIADLYDSGRINTAEAKRIFAFSSTSGPIFMLGTLGSAIFGNPSVGIIILISHYLGAFLNGVLYRFSRRKNPPENDTRVLTKNALSTDNILNETVSKATAAMLAVGSYVVIIGMLVDTLDLIGLNNQILSSLPSEISGPMLALLSGLLETTRGGIAAAQIGDLQIACAVAAFIVSFGGLSVILQSATFMARTKVGVKSIVIRKLTQACISFFIAYIIGFAL